MQKARLLSLLLTALLLACKPEVANSPEQAVYLQLSSNQKIAASSIQIVPATQLRNSFFVFAGYSLKPQGDQDMGNKCTSLFEVVRGSSGWEARGQGGTGCSTNPHTDVFGTHIGKGMDYADGNGSFSFAAGETAIADAVWVEVQWDDGTTQRVPVAAEHFIALIDGNHDPLRFVVLDEFGNEIYTREENYDTEIIEITP